MIVPRSFIAELIPDQFAPWVQHPDAVLNILELCTGSGCLAIMLADAFPNAHIDAVDISADALQVAAHNRSVYLMEERITLIESDLYTKLPNKKYDLIITNPPYVNSSSMAMLPDEYKHEPQLALAGGPDGMDIVRNIIAGAKARLQAHGMLIVEIGNEYENTIAAFAEYELTWLSTSAGDESVFLLHAEQLP